MMHTSRHICPACDDALDPTAPTWEEDFEGRDITPQQAAELLGPVDWDLGFHLKCLDEMDVY